MKKRKVVSCYPFQGNGIITGFCSNPDNFVVWLPDQLDHQMGIKMARLLSYAMMVGDLHFSKDEKRETMVGDFDLQR